MMEALVSVWLFAFGALALAGYFRISRRLGAQAAQTAAIGESAERTEDTLASLGTQIDRLRASIHAQRQQADALREQLAEVIDGPHSKRHPPLSPSGLPHEESDDGATQVWQRSKPDEPTPSNGRSVPVLLLDPIAELPAPPSQETSS